MNFTASGEILLVTSSYPRWQGDATTPFVHHLAQDLRALGWNVHVLAPHAPGAARDETMDGVPVHRFRYLWPESMQTVCYDGGALVKLRENRWNYARIPFLVVAQWLAILVLVMRRKVALLHSHWLLPQGLTAALAAGLFRLPHVTTAHGGDVFALQGRGSRACKRFVIRHADTVTVNSSATEAAVRRLSPDSSNSLRIPMGAGENSAHREAETAGLRARYRKADGPLLIFVGRLVAEKGVDDLLKAVYVLQTSMFGVSALIVGEGPDRGRFEQLSQQLGIEDRVTFCGWLPSDEVHRHLRAADFFVGPSRPAADGWVEAQGLSLIEAMLAGLPVVSTATGGIMDAVRHEQTGLIVKPQSPEEIAAAVRRLACEPELAMRLGRAARELAVQEFTREICAGRFSRLYARLLAQTPSREKK